MKSLIRYNNMKQSYGVFFIQIRLI